ncbi:flavohemoglobin expression-modulating QEGLA motif protein [Autumnicola psychrophila]|uniref:DUF1704 domain-containing protein n=1 Tax=Autumnicola psychrophila TaxID=3075592 RepID=A0ABU3DPN8_9FLAO|nr:tyrosine/phenylalanine carboxypeptidase domain-containing protein [Zunongwangia sp. F225]MDT0685681.1 DUF1704 domain-containing protein [Zunongwangia sp. F225]
MLNISELSKESIKKILTNLKEESETNCKLPGGGLMHIEKEIPYLVIYRKKKKDLYTNRMVISESSYLIIGEKDFEGYRELIFAISDKLSVKFESYMLLEMYAGENGSSTFLIKGPSRKLPTTLKVLQDELNKINRNFSGLYLKAEIQDTKERQAKDDEPLLSLEQTKRCGAVLLGLEIPPVYRGDSKEFYPVLFRTYRDFIIRALHIALYDFLRVQTSSSVPSYNALGRQVLKEKVFEIDRELSKIENSYQFLWLVSPSNIYDIKNTFFDSNYDKVLDYHYRLLPIDPDVLKRKLYNLKIEDVDDPAMSQIFREKREELDQQITMLNERGTRNFFYNSIRLHKGIGRELCEEAEQVLTEIEEAQEKYETPDKDLIDSREFSSLARKEFEYFRNQDENFKGKVHIRKDVNIMMVSQGELYVPEDYKMKRKESEALIQHEVGTHMLTYYNGKKQPLQQLSIGLADYDPLQEGLAVMSEYMVDGLTPNRLRTLAGRVVAGKALMDGGDFREIFQLLVRKHGFSPERSFNITSRIMQGGGFLKDIIYLQGLVELRKYLQDGGEYEPLLAGKFGIKHTGVIKELTEREILKPGALRPSYLLTENVKEKLKLIREGLPLSKMVSK